MIKKGATFWNRGLYGACLDGTECAAQQAASSIRTECAAQQAASSIRYRDLAKLMVNKGATKCWRIGCEKTLDEHLQ